MNVVLERLEAEMSDQPGDELLAFHMTQLASIFASRHGEARAAAAHQYARLLDGWAEEARVIRNAEVVRLAEAGAGPSRLGRILGVERARGEQVANRAAKTSAEDVAEVGRIRRRVASFLKRDIDLTN